MCVRSQTAYVIPCFPWLAVGEGLRGVGGQGGADDKAGDEDDAGGERVGGI